MLYCTVYKVDRRRATLCDNAVRETKQCLSDVIWHWAYVLPQSVLAAL